MPRNGSDFDFIDLMSLVSVVLPSFKMGPYIPSALESIAAQTHGEWEILLVDDCGPEDGTRGALEAFAKRHPERRIEYIRHEVNRGVSGARNTGIEHSKGEFVICLDPDDLWSPGFLAAHLASFRKFPNAGVSYSFPELIDAKGNPLGSWDVPSSYVERFPDSLFARNYLNPSATIVRREAAGDQLYFDLSREVHEDWDLWVRLVFRGVEFAFTPEAVNYYRRHDSASSKDVELFRVRTIGLMQKHASQPRLIAAVAGTLYDQQRELAAKEYELQGLKMLYEQSLSRRLRSSLKNLLGERAN